MVKKNKELDKQFEYFTKKIINAIVDTGMVIGFVISMVGFIVAMLGYYLNPFNDDEEASFRLLKDLSYGLYSLLSFVLDGIFNYIDNLPDFVKWAFMGIIFGIVVMVTFAMFYQEFEEEEKPSDSEIWISEEEMKKEDEKKNVPSDGARIYQFSAKLICHAPLSKETLDALTEEIDYLFGENGFSIDFSHEEKTNEVSE